MSVQTPDEARMHAIAKAAAREAVQEWLLTLGIAADDARDVQEAQADFAFLRSQRRSQQRVSGLVLGATITGTVSGLLLAVWVGVKTLVGGGGH